jgi:tRNA dimethylallyltransferase
MRSLLVIGGTTASGKSALALRLATASGAAIVNADASQLYRDLPVLTARTTPGDEALAPHRLYGVLPAEAPISAGLWLDLVAPVLDELRAAGRPAIVVGGTGLYLKALLHGLAPVPEVPAAIRDELRAWAAGVPAVALHARLERQDPLMAGRLRPSDPQRVLRALEVMAATGRSLAEWQARPPRRLALPADWSGVALLPGRAVLLPRVEARLDAMLAAGALDEVAGWARRRPRPGAALDKALGVRELGAAVAGTIDLATARLRTIDATMRYAKRQRTFFRHQLPELTPLAQPADRAPAAEWP